MRPESTHAAPQPDPILVPKGRANTSAQTVKDREKHARLSGADMYVSRLGWCKADPTLAPVKPPAATPIADHVEATASTTSSEEALSDSISSLESTPPSSLHDELLNREPTPTRHQNPKGTTGPDRSAVRASRPCYRCISYMHSVGIKRVFWTTDNGGWEGGKVRDLVDALDSSMENVAKNGMGGPTGNGVFVTKHEVLMLKRMMEQRERSS